MNKFYSGTIRTVLFSVLITTLFVVIPTGHAVSSLQSHLLSEPKGTVVSNLRQLNDLYQLSIGLHDAGYYKNSIKYAKQVYNESLTHRSLSWGSKVMIANNLAVLTFRLGEYGEAARLLKQSLVHIKKHEKSVSLEKQRLLLTVTKNLHELYIASGNTLLAERYLLAISKIERKKYSADHPIMVHQRFQEINLEFQKSNFDYARKLLISHWHQLPIGKLYNEARSETNLLSAKIYIQHGEFDKALIKLNKALDWQQHIDSELNANIYKQLSYVSYKKRQGDKFPVQSLRYHQQRMDILNRLYGALHPRIAQALSDYASVTGHWTPEAKALVIDIYTQCLGSNHPRTRKINRVLLKQRSSNKQVAL
ncbi:hypothetical protein MNBD_GAMMA12-3136 [hydrothermal vent metagenome]|uniref:MalT-like TPR region domain-containing protein n=1 Tax=hydrothermal vent metagenome TaxID=652676 RepID=A0A3B0YVE5_9ZZZZ